MVSSSAQLCGRSQRCAVEAMRTRDEIEFSKKLARIFRKISVDRRASLLNYGRIAGRKQQDSTVRRVEYFSG
jgi:hypothetical protein